MNTCSYDCCLSTVEANDVNQITQLLKIISEPNRLRILCVLQNNQEHCVCEFEQHLKDVSQSLLSHHLADLRKAGLVSSQKRGLRVYYRLTSFGLNITNKVLSLKNKET